MLLAEDVWYDIYSNTHWESVFDVRRLFCLHTVFKEVPKTPTTGWIQNAPGQTHTDKYTPWATKWSIKGTFSPVHVYTTGQRLPKETTESQILFVTCSLLLIIKERDWLNLEDEVILFGICRSLAHIQTSWNANSFCMEQVNKIKRTENYSLVGKESSIKNSIKVTRCIWKHIYSHLISIKSQQSVYISQLFTTSNPLLHKRLRNAVLSAKDT